MYTYIYIYIYMYIINILHNIIHDTYATIYKLMPILNNYKWSLLKEIRARQVYVGLLN